MNFNLNKEEIAIKIGKKYQNALIIVDNSIYVPNLNEILLYKKYNNLKIIISKNILKILKKTFNLFNIFIFIQGNINNFEKILIKKLSSSFVNKKFIIL